MNFIHIENKTVHLPGKVAVRSEKMAYHEFSFQVGKSSLFLVPKVGIMEALLYLLSHVPA